MGRLREPLLLNGEIMNKYMIGILLSVASIGGSMYAMEVTEVVKEKRLNKEQFEILKGLICDDVTKEFIVEVTNQSPEDFENGMPDYMFEYLDGVALQWIVSHADLIIKIRDESGDQAKDVLREDFFSSDNTKNVANIMRAASHLAIQPLLDIFKSLFDNQYWSWRITTDLINLTFQFKDIQFCDYEKLLIGLAGCPKLIEIKLILDRRPNVDLNATDERGKTALGMAVREKHLEVVKLLVEAGADLNQRSDSCAPIFIAAYEYRKKSEIFDYLIKHGADKDARDRRGQTVLQWAIRQGLIEFAKELIDYGFDVNAQDTDGFVPLYFAANNGGEELVSLLIKKGARVNVSDNWDCTPLSHAVECATSKVVKLLLDAGACVTRNKNKLEKTLFDILGDRKRDEEKLKICELLQEF